MDPWAQKACRSGREGGPMGVPGEGGMDAHGEPGRERGRRGAQARGPGREGVPRGGQGKEVGRMGAGRKGEPIWTQGGNGSPGGAMEGKGVEGNPWREGGPREAGRPRVAQGLEWGDVQGGQGTRCMAQAKGQAQDQDLDERSERHYYDR